MKRLLILLSALALLAPVRVSAQDPGDAFSMAVGVSAGVMDGAGVAVAAGVTDWLNVRAGYSMVPSFLIPEYGIDLPKWGSNPATSTAVSGSVASSGNLLVDFHPVGPIFHVTAGFFFGSGELVKAYNTKALPESYQNAGISYYINGDNTSMFNLYRIKPDVKGIMHGSLETLAFRPFLGIGLGSAVPSNRVGATLDLGVEYIGGLDLRADAINMDEDSENIPLTTAGIMQTIHDMRNSTSPTSYDKYVEYVDKLRFLPVLPVLRLSFFVKLF